MESLLIVTVDGLNARFLGPYGNHWVSTPNFNRLASQGTVFDGFHAESDDCSRNMNAMLSRQHPLCSLEHQATPSGILLTDDDRIGDQVTRHFEQVERVDLEDSETNNPIESLFGIALQLAGSFTHHDSSECNRIWVHTRGMFGNWNAPEEIQRWFKDESDPDPIPNGPSPNVFLSDEFDPDERLAYLHAYAAEVVQLDQHLGSLLEAISSLPAPITLVVAGVRGFALGEHLEIGSCGNSLHGEKLHVPLIISSNDRLPTRDEHPLGSHEFFSRVEKTNNATGREGDAHSLILSTNNNLARIQSNHWAYIQAHTGCSLIDETPGQLFVKPDDALEINEVSDICPQVAEELSAELKRQLLAYKNGEIPLPADLSPQIFEPVS